METLDIITQKELAELYNLNETARRVKKRADEMKASLIARLGKTVHESIHGFELKISEVESMRFNTRSFQKAEPENYKKYQESSLSVRLTIKPESV